MRRLGVGVALLCALGTVPACSTIGDPGGMPRVNPHGGTGQFRLLESSETDISGAPGRALTLFRIAFQSAMVVEDRVFYASAGQVDMPPETPMDHPENEIFRDAFEPYAIQRGEVRTEGVGGFNFGPTVLTATEPWEGTEVRDPWVILDDDGSALLFYGAEMGIGLAAAPSLEGTFSKIGTGPILGSADAMSGSPSRPSVVRGIEDGFLLYYDAGGEIRVARSDDGRAFEPLGPVTMTGEDEGMSPEMTIGNPGAVRVEMTSGRVVIRLYFESVRADGSHDIYVAGSEDGIRFERFVREVIDHDDSRFPAPVIFDQQTTLLYASHPLTAGDYQTRTLVVGVSPRTVRFDPPEDP